MSEDHPVFKERIVTSTKAKSITINGIDCLNAGTHNYLGLLNADDIQESAISSINKYGVGSCGPRGFYGTIGTTKTAIELILLNMFDSFHIFQIYRCAFGIGRAIGKVHADGRISIIRLWVRNNSKCNSSLL